MSGNTHCSNTDYLFGDVAIYLIVYFSIKVPCEPNWDIWVELFLKKMKKLCRSSID